MYDITLVVLILNQQNTTAYIKSIGQHEPQHVRS